MLGRRCLFDESHPTSVNVAITALLVIQGRGMVMKSRKSEHASHTGYSQHGSIIELRGWSAVVGIRCGDQLIMAVGCRRFCADLKSSGQHHIATLHRPSTSFAMV